MIRRWVTHGVFIALLAAAIHWLFVSQAPGLIMWRVMAAVGSSAKGGITHGDRPDAAARRIVRPSPDLLYSTCIYDVSSRPYRVVTGVPADTYWSVAFYAANTDNFLVVNDRQAKGVPVTVYIVGPGQSVSPPEPGATVVSSPTAKGLVLFRTLIAADARLPELDQQRRAASCGTVTPR